MGGGTKARGGRSNRIFGSAQPLHQHRQPAVGRAARRRDEPLGDLALEHQGQAFVLADPVEPAQQQRGRDVVGQVGDDLARRLATARPGRAPARRPRPARAGRDSAPPARRARRDSADRARSRRPAGAPSASSARVSPPGPGPISITVAWSSRPAARAMRRVRFRSRMKFWPRLLRAAMPCRAMTSRSGGNPLGSAIATRRRRSARRRAAPPSRRPASTPRSGCRAGPCRCRRCRRRCRDRARCG